jgi:hypothetical protein
VDCFGTSEEIEYRLSHQQDTPKEVGEGLTKVFISPINSPLDPWIRVPLSQIASVTDISIVLISTRRRHTSRHGHTGRWAIFVFNIDDLMIDNIVSAFVHASTIWAGLECLGNILDIKNIRIKDMLSPLQVSLLLQTAVSLAGEMKKNVHVENPQPDSGDPRKSSWLPKHIH